MVQLPVFQLTALWFKEKKQAQKCRFTSAIHKLQLVLGNKYAVSPIDYGLSFLTEN